MQSPFVFWKVKREPKACRLESMKGLDKPFRMSEGLPLADTFPTNMSFHMDPDFPSDILLLDNIDNPDRAILVSSRLGEFLRARQLPFVEYLPVSIYNHKGKVARYDYIIVHPTHAVDAVDLEQSIITRSRFDPNRISAITKMMLIEDRVPPERELFRLKGYWGGIVARRTLASAIDSGGFTAIKWIDVSEYTDG